MIDFLGPLRGEWFSLERCLLLGRLAINAVNVAVLEVLLLLEGGLKPFLVSWRAIPVFVESTARLSLFTLLLRLASHTHTSFHIVHKVKVPRLFLLLESM